MGTRLATAVTPYVSAFLNRKSVTPLSTTSPEVKRLRHSVLWKEPVEKAVESVEKRAASACVNCEIVAVENRQDVLQSHTLLEK